MQWSVNTFVTVRSTLRQASVLGRCIVAQLHSPAILLLSRAMIKLEAAHMAVEVFDSVDRRILAELQTDGRMTNVELATRVGLTAPPCLRRVRALEERGAISGYHAQLNADALGYAITVFAMVSLKSQAEPDLKAFEAHVATLEPVRECHMLNGEIDFILKVVARSFQEFQNFLTSSLTTAPNVASVKTSLTIRTAKNVPGVPVPD